MPGDGSSLPSMEQLSSVKAVEPMAGSITESVPKGKLTNGGIVLPKVEEDFTDGNKKNKKKKKPKEEPTHSVNMRELFKYADKYDIFLMFVGTLGALGFGIALPLLALLFGELTDAFGQNLGNVDELANMVTKTALKFVWVAIGAATAAYLEMACWMLTGERQAARIRSKFLKAVLRQDISYFDLEISTGEVISRMSGDIVLVQEAMGEKVGAYIRLMTTFIGGFAMGFARGWLLTFVMLAALPLLAICGGLMTWVVTRTSSRGQEAYSDAGQVVEQCIGSIRTVAAFTGEAKAVEQYGVSLDKAYKIGCRQGLFSGLGMGVTLLVMFSSYGLALWVGSIFIVNDIGGYTGGKVMSVLFAVLIGGMSLGQASPNLSAFASGKAAAYKIFEVIARTPKIDVYNLDGEIPKTIKGDIEFHKVKFSYPARPDVQIFSDFSLLIPSGKTVALVGESGSGKSTVISLIERFYDPIDGHVSLDGKNLKSLQLRWLRQQVGLVSQEPVLFGTSLMENIAYGKENSTEAEIISAAKMANIYNFIASLPEGFNTQVGERGTQLSGGQKQRVAIARAILKNPQILLLDEATSALDAESEKVVQEALERAMRDRTTVVVAHRLTTIRNADMIAVLQRGVMIESGTHDELVSKPGGAYSQLVHLQAMQSEEKGNVGTSIKQVSDSFESVDLEKSNSGKEASKTKGEQEDVVTELVLSRNPSGLVKRAARYLCCYNGKRNKKTDVEVGGKEKEKKVDVSMGRLIRLNSPEWPLAIVGSIAAGANGAVFPVFSILLSSIIKTFYLPDEKQLRKDADFWSGMFVVLGASCFVVVTTQFTMFSMIGSALVRRVRQMCFSSILHQEVGWFDDSANSSGAIGARLSTDAAQVRAMVGDTLAVLVQNIVTIVVGMVIAFTANWTLTLVVLTVVPLIGFAGAMQMKALQGFSESAKVMYEDASKVANDAVSSIRTVAAFVAEEKVLQLYNEKCSLPLKAGIRRGHVSGLGLGFSNFVMFNAYALAFWYGGQLIKEGKTTFKDVFQVFFAIVMSAMGVAQTAGLAPNMTDVKTAVNSIFKILDRKTKIDADAPGKTLDVVRGDIELVHLKFRYPTRSDVVVLRDLSLSIPAGQTVALVGESGSGKSTVISLLQRFYDPEGGKVTVDGFDVREFQLKWLRRQMGLVSQEPVLFNTSIRENILYGNEGASESEIESAAKNANAHTFISSLPEGYNTVVGERGVQLSGGQKQRIAIARAVARSPSILLLDEATSALDAESERVVQEALEKAMVGRTTIVVAHRLSTIRKADIIAVVQNGAIVEKGRHEELMRISGGAYAALVTLHAKAR